MSKSSVVTVGCLCSSGAGGDSFVRFIGGEVSLLRLLLSEHFLISGPLDWLPDDLEFAPLPLPTAGLMSSFCSGFCSGSGRLLRPRGYPDPELVEVPFPASQDLLASSLMAALCYAACFIQCVASESPVLSLVCCVCAGEVPRFAAPDALSDTFAVALGNGGGTSTFLVL